MKTSDQIEKIAQALVDAQSEWPPIPERQTLKIQGRPDSKYADLTDILEAIAPTLKKNGLAIIQGPSVTEHGPAMATRILHTSGQWIEVCAPIGDVPKQAQAYGSLITYLRRYCLNSALRLKTVDDDGKTAQKAAERSQRDNAPKPPVAPKSAAPGAPEKKLDSRQLTGIWNYMKKELTLDDIGAREFMVKVTGKKSTDQLVQSDVGRISTAIMQEKQRTAEERTDQSAPGWGAGMPSVL